MSISALDFEARKFSDARIDSVMPRNHPSHVFGPVDDCIRCMSCEVLYGGLKSGVPCSNMFEWADGGVTGSLDVPFTGVPVLSIEENFGGSGPDDWHIGPKHNCALCICQDCGVPFEFHKMTDDGDVIHGVVASTVPRWDYTDDDASDRSLRDDFGYSLL